MPNTGTVLACALCVLVTVAAGTSADGAQLPPTAPPPAGTAKIQGRVINATTGLPVGGAEVMLQGSALRTTDADPDGRFEFTGLPAGGYTLRATKVGYGTPGAGGITFEPGRPFSLADGQTLTRDATVLSGGVITGRIVDEFGEPITGLEVRVERYSYGPAGRQLATAQNGVMGLALRTNDLGEYRVFGLVPGDYIVSTRSQQFGAPLTRGPAGARDRGEGYPPTFYPGTTRQAEARPVRVRAGQETPASFGLTGVRMLRVSGRAMNSRGGPAVGLNVFLGVQTSNSSGQLDGGPVGPDGSFSIGNVPAGDYVLRVRQSGATGPGAEVASMPISLSTDDLTDLQLVTRPGTNILGRVEWDGSAPRPANPIRITPRSAAVGNGPIGGESPLTYLDLQSGTVREDDTFEIGGIVGEVLFASSPAAPWTLKSVTLEGRDITSTGVDAATLGGDRRIVVTLTDRVNEVSGTVRDAPSTPVDAAVVILPQQAITGAGATRHTRFLRPDEAGSFVLRGLPQGDYVAGVVEGLESGSEWDPAIQKRVRAAGQRFTVGDGQTVTLTLDVLR